MNKTKTSNNWNEITDNNMHINNRHNTKNTKVLYFFYGPL